MNLMEILKKKICKVLYLEDTSQPLSGWPGEQSEPQLETSSWRLAGTSQESSMAWREQILFNSALKPTYKSIHAQSHVSLCKCYSWAIGCDWSTSLTCLAMQMSYLAPFAVIGCWLSHRV
jgi:hypothetical protein